MTTRRSTGLKVPYVPEDDAPVLKPGDPLPFRVHRTNVGNIPVYSDTRSGGSKVVTIVRKYGGDVHALIRAVQHLCKSDVQHFHGRIEVKGRHTQKLKNWLIELGF